MADSTLKGGSRSSSDRSAREKLEIELYRLESIFVEELIPFGLIAKRGDCVFQFKDPPSKIFKYEYDSAQFLAVAQSVAVDPEASYDTMMAAGLGFILQEKLWPDFRTGTPNWQLAWLMAALAGAYPPAPADQRIKEPLNEEIEAMLPDAWRGRKTIDSARMGSADRSAMADVRHKLWQDRADKLFNANPKMTIRSAAQRIEKDLGVLPENGWEAIRRVIKKPKK